jgi:signal transduction histidine kinase
VQVTRPTRLDALLAVATFCLVAAAVTTHGGRPAQVAAGGLFALGFAALPLLARARPAPALLAAALCIVGYYTLDLAPIGLAAPVAATLYVAADHGRVWWAGLTAAALLAVSVAARLVEGDDAAYVVGLDLGAQAALLLAVIALGDATRSRRSVRAEMARRAAAAAEDRRREAARQVEAERLHIAREMHDTLGHAIAVVTLQAAVAQEALDDRLPERARAALDAIRSAGDGAMAELSATLGSLRAVSGVRAPAPGVDRLPSLADRVSDGGLPVDLHVEGGVDALPAVVGTTAYRVVQESLTNALRHAGATRARVTVRATGAGLAVEIVDDGRGANPAPAGGDGQGLRGMAERVALLGGHVEFGDADGGGFRVYAHLPLPGERA